MRVIETTAYVGNDGMLRLEVPLDQRNQDVRIALVVESEPTPAISEPEPTMPIWDQFQRIVADATPEDVARLPADGAKNHDKYIYGDRRASE